MSEELIRQAKTVFSDPHAEITRLERENAELQDKIVGLEKDNKQAFELGWQAGNDAQELMEEKIARLEKVVEAASKVMAVYNDFPDGDMCLAMQEFSGLNNAIADINYPCTKGQSGT
jgi:predicted nucleotide-binding protein (sugar kinase/HSP70/actin superfamily)